MYPVTSEGPGAASTASEARNTFLASKEPNTCSAFRLVMNASRAVAFRFQREVQPRSPARVYPIIARKVSVTLSS